MTHWYVFKLIELQCIKSDDFSGDEAILKVFVDPVNEDSHSTAEFKQKMSNGNIWQVNQEVPFKNKIKIELWDQELIGKDDFLGEGIISTDSEKEGIIDFCQHGASYKLKYAFSFKCTA